MTELNAITAIALRDVLKFLRDRTRIVSTFIFPVIFVVVLGRSFGSAGQFPFDYPTFVFVGVLGQTIFQSAAIGLVSLIEDRENDFSQAMFVAPISRLSIVTGKIVGESAVAMVQGLFILLFGFLVGVSISPQQLVLLLPAAVVICLFGGAFGLLIMANLGSQRAANQVFPFIFLPQFFLAGVFNPIGDLGPVLTIASAIAPMRYPIDLLRGLFYQGLSDYEYVVLLPPYVNLAVILVAGTVFLAVGTTIFVRSERNR